MDDYAKEIEEALDKTLKDDLLPKVNGGPTRPSNVTLAVELDAMIEGVKTRLDQLETIKSALQKWKATL